MRWFEKQRIEWIKNRKGPFNRADLMSAFDISQPQASCDIQKYLSMYPNALIYNLKKKRYEINNHYVNKDDLARTADTIRKANEVR